MTQTENADASGEDFQPLDPNDFVPEKPLQLGAFSVSLSVTDLEISIEFYEQLGFVVTGGDRTNGYVIMVNAQTVIGLFENMFEGNILTFNPGLSVLSGIAQDFTDIRDIQTELDTRGLNLGERTDPEGTGPGHITLTDPDGNAILIDQHFPKPAKNQTETAPKN